MSTSAPTPGARGASSWRQGPLYRLGLLLVASGLAHAGVWAALGGPLTGPVSWRKPIVFGLSVGVTTLSLAWVVAHLRPSTRLRWSIRLYVPAMALEVGLITMQQWRGVGSHFNTATPFDTAVFQAMGILILVASGVIAAWTWWSFTTLEAPHDTALAIRAGLLLLNTANLLGVFLVAYGNAARDAGLPPNVFGAAGQLKLPHAVALHGIQALPILTWVLARAGVGVDGRRRGVALAATGYGALLLFTLLQTFAGRPPLEVTPLSALVGVAACVLLLGSLAPGLAAVRRAA